MKAGQGGKFVRGIAAAIAFSKVSYRSNKRFASLAGATYAWHSASTPITIKGRATAEGMSTAQRDGYRLEENFGHEDRNGN